MYVCAKCNCKPMKTLTPIRFFLPGLVIAFSVMEVSAQTPSVPTKPVLDAKTLTYPGEVHLKNVRQLTFGGDNAEAYWSFSGKSLVFQANYKEWGTLCDQIFLYEDVRQVEKTPKMLSTGLGRTTCSTSSRAIKKLSMRPPIREGMIAPGAPARRRPLCVAHL